MEDTPDRVDGLLDAALRRLSDVGIHAEVRSVSGDQGGDLHARLFAHTGPSGDPWDYVVQFKKRLPAGSAGIMGNHSERTLIVANQVPEAVADVWRAHDVHFVDTTGNMYLRWPNLLVDIRGRRRPTLVTKFVVPGRPQRTFKSAGLKVVFMLLCQPDTIDLPVRAAATLSGAAHGTVQNVLRELDQTGYLDTRHRVLRRTHELFDQWVEAYILNLWPALTLGRFTAPDPMWWTSADEAMHAVGALWGGETAAHRFNSYLRPGGTVIYAPDILRDLIVGQRFRKAEGQGNVEIRRRFWSFAEPTPRMTVPTPLVYADLIASADPRQHEAAAALRETDEVLRRLDQG